jgi:hypothetical protein
LVGNVAEAAVLTETLQAPATIENAMERNRGDLVQRADGSFAFEGGEDLLTSAYKAEASSIIENFTELGMGGSFGGWLERGLMKAGNSKVGRKVGLGYVTDLVSKVGSPTLPRASPVLLTRRIGMASSRNLWRKSTASS